MTKEIKTLQPSLIVCLGATAAQSLLGSSFKVTVDHGTIQRLISLPPIIATLHPSAILRAATDEDRERQMGILLEDMGKVKKALASLKAA